MFDGYLSLGGTEIINAARTKAYVDNNAPSIPLRNCVDCGDLNVVLGDGEYDSPLVDNAPWYDPNQPSSNGFYGVYPLEVQGIEDSTRTASVTESVTDGGSVGQQRNATRSIRVRGLMVASSQLAMSNGMTWLRSALNPPPCSDHGGSCGGAQLCYYAACPAITTCFEADYSSVLELPVIAETPETTPSISRQVPPGVFWKSRLEPTIQDGIIVRWGAVSTADTNAITEAHGPVVLRRTNAVRNPRFAHATPTNGWTITGGGTFVGTGAFPDTYAVRTVSTPGVAAKVRSADMDAYAGQVVASFDLWVEESATVPNLTVRLRRTSDNVVLAEAEFIITSTQRRYSFTAPAGGNSYLEFEADQNYNIAKVMVEAGFTPLPYFDGASPEAEAMAGYLTGDLSPEYSITWLGTANNSQSRALWLGELRTGVAQGVDYDESLDGTCDAYPWLDVIQGTVNGTLSVSIRQPLTVDEQAAVYERTLHEVSATEGPTIIGDRVLDSGAVLREVDFVMVAGRPSPYGSTSTVLSAARMIDLDTITWVDPDCSAPEPTPIVDPDCITPTAPPRPPQINSVCVTPETVWQRYWLPVPASYVSAWSSTSPQVTITSGTQEIRQVRVRVYPNPYNRDPGVGLFFRENRAYNPALKLTSEVWSNLGGVGTATGRMVGGSLHCGVNFYRATASGSHGADTFGPVLAGAGYNLIAPGEGVRPSIDVRSSVARNVKLRYAFIDISNAVIGSVQYGPVTAVAANTWTRLELTGTAPVTAPANTVRMAVGVTGDTAAWSAGQTLDATAPTLEFRSEWPGPLPVLDEWWNAERLADDCSRLPGDGLYYGWAGTEGVSESHGTTSPIDPCSWCSEFVVSYLPAQTTLTVDAILERAFASVVGGGSSPANHLLYSADGSPMIWPELTCGIDYLLAIDVPEPLLDDVTVSVTLTNKE